MKWTLKGIYSEMKSLRIAAAAGRAHAKQGLDAMPDVVITPRLGILTPWDPKGNEDHARIEAATHESKQLAKWKKEKEEKVEALNKYPKRILLWIIFIGLLFVEFLGINELLAGQGMERPHRTIVAVAGACIFFYLTYQAAKKDMSKAWFGALITGIALFVLSMAILWHDNTASEDTNALTTWASAIFLVFVVCGPGLLAKSVFAQLVPVEELAKNRRRLQRLIKPAEAEIAKAEALKNNIIAWEKWHTQEREKMLSTYRRHYLEAGGKKDNPYKLRSVG